MLSGCDQLTHSEWFTKLLGSAEKLSFAAQRLLLSRKAMAQEFTEADLSPGFRSNGTSNPDNPAYQALAANGFADYRLQIGGLVAQPRAYSLDELKALPSRTQITRHDCVEGWSAIGKWKGVQLSHLLEQVKPQPSAKYVVFYCADPMDESGTRYYESIDMDDAWHAQTLLAYELNDAAATHQEWRTHTRARRASAGLQDGQIHHADTTRRPARRHRGRQGRLLGRPGLRVVCRYLIRAACNKRLDLGCFPGNPRQPR